MFLLFPKSRTITDDRGKSHVISWSANANDESNQHLARRAYAEILESTGHGTGPHATLRTVAFVFGFVVVMLGAIFAFSIASVPRSLTPFLIPVPILGLLLIYMWYKRRSYRPMCQRVAIISIEEGACGACWYDLRQLPPGEDGMLVCPECQAAWLASRVLSSAREMRPGEEPLPKGDASDHKEIESMAKFLAVDLPTPVKDEKGRTFSLVRSRDLRRHAERSEGELRARYLEASASLRSAGMVRRYAAVLGILVFAGLMFTTNASRMTLTSRSPGDWLFLLVMLYGVVYIGLRGIGLFFRTDGVKPARATPLLLARSLCPSCGSSLFDIESNAEGHTVCTQCSAAWKMPATTDMRSVCQPPEMPN
ncbi:MAG: hypothetical protein H7210_11760 [Pyrinomonadaceae bacterium]|nr:hypothetical protein [Phycisphaerales bacterium]